MTIISTTSQVSNIVNNQEFILATSGFILPKNTYFEVFKNNDSLTDEIFNRSLVVSTSSSLINYFKENLVYKSNTVNECYNRYLTTKEFNDYITLIDIVVDILKDIDINVFFQLQATNKHLSSIAFNFCLDVTSGKFYTNYSDYNIIPFNIRFSINNNLTTQDTITNLKKIENNFKSSNIYNWELLLSKLAADRDAFLVFYKFMFADYY